MKVECQKKYRWERLPCPCRSCQARNPCYAALYELSFSSSLRTTFHSLNTTFEMRWRAVAATVSLFWQLAAADSNLTSPQSSQQVLTGDFKPPQVFENENVVRNTNLEKGYVRETVNVVVKNVDKSPQSDYYLPFEYDVMGKVGGLDVRDKKHAEKGAFEVTTAAMTAVLDADGTSSK